MKFFLDQYDHAQRILVTLIAIGLEIKWLHMKNIVWAAIPGIFVSTRFMWFDYPLKSFSTGDRPFAQY